MSLHNIDPLYYEAQVFFSRFFFLILNFFEFSLLWRFTSSVLIKGDTIELYENN